MKKIDAYLNRISSVLAIIQTVAIIFGWFSGFSDILAVIAVLLLIFNIVTVYKCIKLKTTYLAEIEKTKKLYLKQNTAVMKYLIKSLNRDEYNDFTLRNVNITYEITDNAVNRDFFDFTITYHFEGYSNCNGVDYMKIYTNIFRFDDDKCATYCDNTGNYGEIELRKNFKNENGSIFSKLYFGETKSINNAIDMVFKWDWKNYGHKEYPDMTIIDPLNYAKNVQRVNISVINKSKTKNIERMVIYGYNRKSQENVRDFLPKIHDERNQRFEHTFESDINDETVFAFALTTKNKI